MKFAPTLFQKICNRELLFNWSNVGNKYDTICRLFLTVFFEIRIFSPTPSCHRPKIELQSIRFSGSKSGKFCPIILNEDFYLQHNHSAIQIDQDFIQQALHRVQLILRLDGLCDILRHLNLNSNSGWLQSAEPM